MRTTISVLMPVYNAVDYIAEATSSALEQLSAFDELVVQDALSTDGTAEFLASIAAKDSRLKLISEKDSGQSDALNRALARATGDFVLWLNADDIIRPDAIAALRAVVEDAPDTELVTGGHATARADGSVIREYMPQKLDHRRLMNRGCYIFSGSVLVARLSLNKAGGFTDQYHYCMDLDLMFRLVQIPANRTARVEHVIGVLRWHDASKSGGHGRKFVGEGYKVRQRYRRGWSDNIRAVRAAGIQALAIATTEVRHSPLYTVIRRGVHS